MLPAAEYNPGYLCIAYYGYQQKPHIFSYAGDYRLPAEKRPEFDRLGVDTVAFLKKFMDARGQWSYIESQDWYKNHEYVIAIEVNYYGNRSGKAYTMSPMFHKDTGGNNLFVNLIFDNKKAIEATEWFVDVQEPSGKRAEWQKTLLPEAHLKDLAALRRQLLESGEYAIPKVNGGVLEGENIYVSWVDDLVWHATPSLNERIAYTADAAIEAYPLISIGLKEGKTFPQGPVHIHPVELLATIADEPNSQLAKWLTTKHKRIQDLDFELARTAWFALYETNEPNFSGDVKLRGEKPWHMVGDVAQSISYDARLDKPDAKAPTIEETPAGLSMVRRANSLDKARLKEVVEANKEIPRSFIRTWVRVIPRTAEELKTNNVVLK
ncbi:hypothetical protein AMES_5611 [Amycolatopsis mediterranei S699]|uniref:Uncharacterized protein n=2 Tax=Amycolatopsis mediterranei TaxID=33910 RepID=A0A0H3D9W1_AMYMU|nr:hypothetical protein AMED_5685 [Amycolatopsis mediterranei U32]AEK44283.1 hypothetical protein RAM_29030 [Amycolatopsis mediterranei S699]AGT86275.1 hypothetical protein B737_5611 [Amycolatopsis mediterranei RB]KDO12640.1 hypothetical protein DV26_01600 [Amycolatopsis mediterranei]AFO79147.1 hypothetical protein AMES_5611 [Amycolatopsis mediterranei S699]